ncbi:hypothetical protein V8F06_011973, partial [Rhypophila decipiens]
NCPSPESNLGVFAAVNLAMLLLTPILGRRTVVAKLSFGVLGKAHSQGWILMGPITACMHTAANLINVALIRATPGYESASVAMLTMLWFTRPRLAWLVIALVVFQADEAMYLSCAATTLTAEILLQLLTAYVMGSVANHARRQSFYSLSHGRDILEAVPRGGGDALAMDAGALLWHVVVVVMIYAVAWVTKMRSSLRNAIRNTLIGMFACWVAQWLFWVGFVRLYTPDAYCPPKLTYLALTWIFISVFGVPLGASY